MFNTISHKVKIIAESTVGSILEIIFRGTHWDGCGNEMIEYVEKCVDERKPAAVLMNLTGFTYFFGDDIEALLFPLVKGKVQIVCIVARGRTAKSLKSLFDLTKIQELIEVHYFDKSDDALELIKRRLAK